MISPARPARDAVGWCHNCETWQLGGHARFQEMYWSRGDWDWSCVECDGEPWGLGVWRVTDSPNDSNWCTHLPYLAEYNVVSYGCPVPH